MRSKLKITLIVTLILAAVIFAGVWHNASAAYITSKTYQIGNLGIYLPNGFNPNNVWIERTSKGGLGGAPVKFSRSLMTLHFVDDSGHSSSTPYILTYVFFNLNSNENHAWDKNKLSIYYFNVRDGNWKKCPTFVNFDVYAPNGRASCLAPQYTTYGLGISK